MSPRSHKAAPPKQLHRLPASRYCPDVIDSIPKLMRDEKNIEDAQKEGNELFLDVCESFCYSVMSYGSEQTIPREVQIQREIMSIKDNTQKYQRYLELTAKRTNSIAFTIPRGRRCWQMKS